MKQTSLWQLRSNLDKTQQVQADIQVLDFAGKFKESVKRGGLFFVLAVVSIFIPVLHFFLVPLFLLLSVAFFIMTFRTDRKLAVALDLPCQKCQKIVVVKAQAFRFPLQTRCPHCGEDHQLKES